MNEAYNQLEDWKSYIGMNEPAFRSQLAELVKGKPAFCSNAAVHTWAETEIRDPMTVIEYDYRAILATVYKGNIIKNLIMDCQSYTKYRPNETTGGIFVSWRRKEELPTGA